MYIHEKTGLQDNRTSRDYTTAVNWHKSLLHCVNKNVFMTIYSKILVKSVTYKQYLICNCLEGILDCK